MLIGKLAYFVFRIDQFDTAGLATTAGVYLGLNDPTVTADFPGCCNSFVCSIYGNALGYWQPILSKQLLCLIFMKVNTIKVL